MSTQDKYEGILKEIHLAMANGEIVDGDPNKVVVNKSQVFEILERLNIAVNDLKDEYEATVQSREMAEKRAEKRGQEMIDRVTRQADDIYAAALIYTEDALNKIYHLMEDSLERSQEIFKNTAQEMEKEQRKIKDDQLELRGQLQDFKDSNKYLAILEENEREREKQEKEASDPEKKIQNKAKHYKIDTKPEIRVNAAYFERRQQQQEEELLRKATLGEDEQEVAQIMMDLDAEYFNWKEGHEQEIQNQPALKKIIKNVKKQIKSFID